MFGTQRLKQLGRQANLRDNDFCLIDRMVPYKGCFRDGALNRRRRCRPERLLCQLRARSLDGHWTAGFISSAESACSSTEPTSRLNPPRGFSHASEDFERTITLEIVCGGTTIVCRGNVLAPIISGPALVRFGSRFSTRAGVLNTIRLGRLADVTAVNVRNLEAKYDGCAIDY